MDHNENKMASSPSYKLLPALLEDIPAIADISALALESDPVNGLLSKWGPYSDHLRTVFNVSFVPQFHMPNYQFVKAVSLEDESRILGFIIWFEGGEPAPPVVEAGVAPVPPVSTEKKASDALPQVPKELAALPIEHKFEQIFRQLAEPIKAKHVEKTPHTCKSPLLPSANIHLNGPFRCFHVDGGSPISTAGNWYCALKVLLGGCTEARPQYLADC